MKYWYCYIPAMLALLPLLLSTICDCIADSAKQRAARKNPPKQRPEIISADDTPAPTPAADTPAAPKRGRGRPRKYPPADPAAPKRKRGRPRKNQPTQRPTQRAEIISAADTPAAAPERATAAPAAPTPAADTPAPALPLLLPTLDPIVYTPDTFAALIAD